MKVTVGTCALILACLLAAPVNAMQPGCFIFNQEEWEGQARYLQPNTRYGSLDSFRNSTKSVMVSRSCRVVVFERERFEGPKREFDEDRKRLGSWENKVESLRCQCN
jgi:hypothetical protein